MKNNAEYTSLLRRARAAFRERELETASNIIRALTEKYGHHSELEAMTSAIRKFQHAMMNRALKANDYIEAQQFATALLGDVEFGEQAATGFVGCARALAEPPERAAILKARQTELEAFDCFWEAMAECLSELPPTAESIETGFAVLRRLPGHAHALDALGKLVAHYRQEAVTPAMSARTSLQ